MIKAFSKKRAKENRQYLKARQTFLEKRNECEAGLKGCSGIATDLHHSAGRLGKNLLDESKWIPLCRNCHTIIHNDPVMATEKNLSISRLKIVANEQ